MIRIWVDWGESVCTMEGHAGWAVAGEDIVCAGVSALAQTYLRNLERREEKRLIGKLDAEIGSGSLQTRNDNRGYWQKRRWTELTEDMMEGMEMIRKVYPERIEIEEHGRKITDEEEEL